MWKVVKSRLAAGPQSCPSIFRQDSYTCAGLQVVSQSTHNLEGLLPPAGTESEPFQILLPNICITGICHYTWLTSLHSA